MYNRAFGDLRPMHRAQPLASPKCPVSDLSDRNHIVLKFEQTLLLKERRWSSKTTVMGVRTSDESSQPSAKSERTQQSLPKLTNILDISKRLNYLNSTSYRIERTLKSFIPRGLPPPLAAYSCSLGGCRCHSSLI